MELRGGRGQTRRTKRFTGRGVGPVERGLRCGVELMDLPIVWATRDKDGAPV